MAVNNIFFIFSAMRTYDNRRYRKNKIYRDLFAEVTIDPKQLIQPLFLYEGLQENREIPNLTGQFQYSLEGIKQKISHGLKAKLSSFLLFIVPEKKAEDSFQYDFDCESIRQIKEEFGEDILLFNDLCLCSQTTNGHCCLYDSHGVYAHGKTLSTLNEKALLYAQAGSDVISPSDMNDHRIKEIRQTLDNNQREDTLIMSYSTKFASHFYGPFRDAAQSAPGFGDRKSYQIDYRNRHDALSSSIRDYQQGADILMVKPAMNYLDIIQGLKNTPELHQIPLAAYHVSGHYQSLKLMEKQNLVDFDKAYEECLYSMKRAGADLIITYGAADYCQRN